MIKELCMTTALFSSLEFLLEGIRSSWHPTPDSGVGKRDDMSLNIPHLFPSWRNSLRGGNLRNVRVTRWNYSIIDIVGLNKSRLTNLHQPVSCHQNF